MSLLHISSHFNFSQYTCLALDSVLENCAEDEHVIERLKMDLRKPTDSPLSHIKIKASYPKNTKKCRALFACEHTSISITVTMVTRDSVVTACNDSHFSSTCHYYSNYCEKTPRVRLLIDSANLSAHFR